MQILAQGIVTSVAPYLHLGYAAANGGPLLSWSDPVPLASSLVHLPLFFGVGMGAVGFWMAWRAFRQGQTPRGLAISALICLACLALAGAGQTGPGPPAEEVTVARATRILQVVSTLTGDSATDRPLESLRDPRLHLPRYTGSPAGHAPSPPDFLEGQVHTDYWGREFELKSRIETRRWTDSGAKTWEVKLRKYWLVSAGPDGQFGTADDIVIDPARK